MPQKCHHHVVNVPVRWPLIPHLNRRPLLLPRLCTSDCQYPLGSFTSINQGATDKIATSPSYFSFKSAVSLTSCCWENELQLNDPDYRALVCSVACTLPLHVPSSAVVSGIFVSQTVNRIDFHHSYLCRRSRFKQTGPPPQHIAVTYQDRGERETSCPKKLRLSCDEVE
ncbi:hypothetical protein EG68_00874 [Paragonimus skrjabini miyazakii]|uniref:Uncharacterized protein n=1 Tax=Paragonimus skrjabini miyazakii TaxID=59628 RepID=A0A8S9ZCM2_9TREM|nr:hypothetical protein EG68_00874 [Paragonimus skrjabini miyazakii]